MIRPARHCVRRSCPARRIAYRLCSRHWGELCARAGATRADITRTLKEDA